MEEQISYELKIPKERVAVLIGKKGEIKKKIEEATKSKLEISSEGDVLITGTDGLTLFYAQEITKAIARGFNPKNAFLLLDPNNILEIINMKDVVGKNKNTITRLKARVIGRKGKARKEIERLTETKIVIYGKTIGIIGNITSVSLARKAISMLLNGSMHKTVYHFLEKKRKEMILMNL